MTAAVLDAVTDLGWSLVGLVVGFLLGVSVRIAVVEPHVTADHREWLQRILGVLLLVAVVVAGTQVWTAQQQLATQIECEAAYASEFHAALTAQLEATRDDRAALRKAAAAIAADAPSDPALRRLVIALDELERMRSKHPLPARPDCGGGS